MFGVYFNIFIYWLSLTFSNRWWRCWCNIRQKQLSCIRHRLYVHLIFFIVPLSHLLQSGIDSAEAIPLQSLGVIDVAATAVPDNELLANVLLNVLLSRTYTSVHDGSQAVREMRGIALTSPERPSERTDWNRPPRTMHTKTLDNHLPIQGTTQFEAGYPESQSGDSRDLIVDQSMNVHWLINEDCWPITWWAELHRDYCHWTLLLETF